MGVMLQAFYWDCPKAESREHQWWTFIQSKLGAIAQDHPPLLREGLGFSEWLIVPYVSILRCGLQFDG